VARLTVIRFSARLRLKFVKVHEMEASESLSKELPGLHPECGTDLGNVEWHLCLRHDHIGRDVPCIGPPLG
jgi:hypothetical protein